MKKTKKKLTKEDVSEIITVYDKYNLADKFMALSKNKRITLIACCALVLALIVGTVVKAAMPKYSAEVSLIEVSTGNVTETISSTGKVISTSKTTYQIFDGVKVQEVDVKLGDSVEKGQKLASFDCASAKALVDEKKEAYDKAKKAYDDTIQAAKTASTTLPQIESKIAKLEKEIAAAQQKEEAANTAETTQAENQGLLARIEKLVENLSNLGGSFDMSSVMGSSGESMQLQMQYIELLTQKATLEAQSNTTTQDIYKSLMESAEKTYQQYQNAYTALEKGWVAEKSGIVTVLNINADTAFDSDTVQTQSQAVDLSAIMSAMSGGLDVNQIVSGFSSSGLSNGAVIDNYDDFEIEFVISKYDINKVKLDQKVTVTALDETLEGYVSYISPTIDSSDGLDIGSIASSLTGGSSSGGLNAKVKINNPTSSVIIGLTVDLLVETSVVENTTVVPLEGIEMDGKNYYVYVYNEKDKTIEKREIQVGISSDTLYQIVSGCEAGDKIVKNPKSNLVDGSKVKISK